MHLSPPLLPLIPLSHSVINRVVAIQSAGTHFFLQPESMSTTQALRFHRICLARQLVSDHACLGDMCLRISRCSCPGTHTTCQRLCMTTCSQSQDLTTDVSRQACLHATALKAAVLAPFRLFGKPLRAMPCGEDGCSLIMAVNILSISLYRGCFEGPFSWLMRLLFAKI